MMIEKKFKAEKDKIRERLAKIPGVVGVGAGVKLKAGEKTDVICITVYVKAKRAKGDLGSDNMIPDSIKLSDGTVVITDVIEAGELSFYGFTGKYRPVHPGAVISHPNAQYPGTYGAKITDNTDGKKVMLSANHSVANFGAANIGDDIWQPGPQHGGDSSCAIGTLKRYVPIDQAPGGENLVDAAIVKPNVQKDVKGRPFCNQIKKNKQGIVGMLMGGSAGITIINDISHVLTLLNCSAPRVTAATVGMSIHKCGAATGYTSTTVHSIDTDLLLQMPSGNAVWFRDQIITAGGISDAAAGDSGAVFYTTFNV